MLKAIIVDNEEPAINILKILLERTRQVTVIDSFLSAADALAGLVKVKPDVAFLDIEMPEINGLELAGKILEINNDIEIIFVTAYDQYALNAFRVNALDYLLKPLSFEDIEQTISRLIKRRGLLTDSNLKLSGNGRIYCFGKLSAYGTGSKQPVKWRTSKAEELFAYMLQNLEKEVSKWKICEALWPEYVQEKVDIQLHTTIYKMKKVLSSAGINLDFSFNNGCYWMSLPQVYIDMVEFDSLAASVASVEEGTIEKYEKALLLYKGGYLEDNDYLWALSKREEYFIKYLKLATSIVVYYMQRNEYIAAEKILHEILEKSPLNEVAHEMLLKCYFIKKDQVSFITHYLALQKLFKDELGIEPSKSIQALYNSIQI
ncbi:response regulator [Ruminiclostridium cellobioparum]|uniref:Stage 0 sporulation protein A homolog n=1 Tax=Ruminiclostridium cellobioparum subsp. termitidis CT1112 TaxID=1195236 RepID=S0FXT0_RUMCE|nr:response regulator [Ruminiclostridium cellobioparum]EMS73919.1 response regulator receiver/SARP domain-containing protein [Ruminiclostridium cellobioparum subsp. termitidis CT1112]